MTRTTLTKLNKKTIKNTMKNITKEGNEMNKFNAANVNHSSVLQMLDDMLASGKLSPEDYVHATALRDDLAKDDSACKTIDLRFNAHKYSSRSLTFVKVNKDLKKFDLPDFDFKLFYFLGEMTCGNNLVRVSIPDLCKALHLKPSAKNKVSNALKNLVKHNLLNVHTPHTNSTPAIYEVNPQYFNSDKLGFHASRLVKKDSSFMDGYNCLDRKIIVEDGYMSIGRETIPGDDKYCSVLQTDIFDDDSVDNSEYCDTLNVEEDEMPFPDNDNLL